jgi:hypothetical protein
MKTNSKRFNVVFIENYLVLDNENSQKIVYGTGKDGKPKTKIEAEMWADEENHKNDAK